MRGVGQDPGHLAADLEHPRPAWGRAWVEPRNVIAFTFTEKAAAELKDRVLSIVADEHGDVTGLAEMYIGTMHAFCLNLLQTHVPETFKYGVLTEITQRLFN